MELSKEIDKLRTSLGKCQRQLAQHQETQRMQYQSYMNYVPPAPSYYVPATDCQPSYQQGLRPTPSFGGCTAITDNCGMSRCSWGPVDILVAATVLVAYSVFPSSHVTSSSGGRPLSRPNSSCARGACTLFWRVSAVGPSAVLA